MTKIEKTDKQLTKSLKIRALKCIRKADRTKSPKAKLDKAEEAIKCLRQAIELIEDPILESYIELCETFKLKVQIDALRDQADQYLAQAEEDREHLEILIKKALSRLQAILDIEPGNDRIKTEINQIENRFQIKLLQMVEKPLLNFKEDWNFRIKFKLKGFQELLENWDGYYQYNLKEDSIEPYLYTLDFKLQDILIFREIYEELKTATTVQVYIDGKLIHDEVFTSWLQCYGNYLRTRSSHYCYGATPLTYNFAGCHKAQMRDMESRWENCWFRYGEMDPSLGIFFVDKEQLFLRIQANLLSYSFCPALNPEKLKLGLELLPNSINPQKDKNWDYVLNKGERVGVIPKGKEIFITLNHHFPDTPQSLETGATSQLRKCLDILEGKMSLDELHGNRNLKISHCNYCSCPYPRGSTLCPECGQSFWQEIFGARRSFFHSFFRRLSYDSKTRNPKSGDEEGLNSHLLEESKEYQEEINAKEEAVGAGYREVEPIHAASVLEIGLEEIAAPPKERGMKDGELLDVEKGTPEVKPETGLVLTREEEPAEKIHSEPEATDEHEAEVVLEHVDTLTTTEEESRPTDEYQSKAVSEPLNEVESVLNQLEDEPPPIDEYQSKAVSDSLSEAEPVFNQSEVEQAEDSLQVRVDPDTEPGQESSARESAFRSQEPEAGSKELETETESVRQKAEGDPFLLPTAHRPLPSELQTSDSMSNEEKAENLSEDQAHESYLFGELFETSGLDHSGESPLSQTNSEEELEPENEELPSTVEEMIPKILEEDLKEQLVVPVWDIERNDSIGKLTPSFLDARHNSSKKEDLSSTFAQDDLLMEDFDFENPISEERSLRGKMKNLFLKNYRERKNLEKAFKDATPEMELTHGENNGNSSSRSHEKEQLISSPSEPLNGTGQKQVETELIKKAKSSKPKSELSKRGVVRIIYSAIIDRDTCPLCRFLHGMVFHPDQLEAEIFKPPLHKGCKCMRTYILSNEKPRNWPEVTFEPPPDELLKHLDLTKLRQYLSDRSLVDG